MIQRNYLKRGKSLTAFIILNAILMSEYCFWRAERGRRIFYIIIET